MINLKNCLKHTQWCFGKQLVQPFETICTNTNWWEKLDLNQRRLAPADLQSASFDQTWIFSRDGGTSRN